MVTRFGAVYEGGLFRPTGPVDLPEGTAVEITVPTTVSEPGSEKWRDPKAVFERMMAIANMPDEVDDGDMNVSSRVDEILYGGPGGAK